MSELKRYTTSLAQENATWVAITEASSIEESQEKLKAALDAMLEADTSTILKHMKAPVEVSPYVTEWSKKQLKWNTGYKGYYVIAILDGVQISEGWLDGVDGVKSVYKRVRVEMNTKYGVNTDLILYVSREYRNTKRPNEDANGNIYVPVKDAVKRGSGVEMGGILKGIKELKIGNLRNIRGVAEVVALLDKENVKASIKEKRRFEGFYFRIRYDAPFCPYWYTYQAKGKLQIDTLRRDNVLDVLELSDTERNLQGCFKLSAHEYISIESVLELGSEAIRLAEETQEHIQKHLEEVDKAYYKTITIKEALQDKEIALSSLIEGILETLEVHEVCLDTIYDIDDRDYVLQGVLKTLEGYRTFLDTEDMAEISQDVIDEEYSNAQEAQELLKILEGVPDGAYWLQTFDEAGVPLTIQEVNRENLEGLLDMSDADKNLVGRFGLGED